MEFHPKKTILLSVYVIVGLWITYTFFKASKTEEVVFSIEAGTKEISSVVKWRPEKSPPIYSMSCIKTVVVIGKSNLGNVQCAGNTPFAHIYPHINRPHDSLYFTCRLAI